METKELQRIIETLVVEALERRLGQTSSSATVTAPVAAQPANPSAALPNPPSRLPIAETPIGKPIILTKEDLESIPFGGTFPLPPKAILTDLAREYASEKQISLVPAGLKEQAIAIGADHGGYELKEKIKNYLQGLGYPLRDFGAFNRDPVDYPDLALAVAMSVARHECFVGLIIDAAGIGSCMAANKVPGIRAACCWDEASARNSREHNFANILTLGGRSLDDSTAYRIVHAWLETPYGGERHALRIKKITAIEAKYLRNVNL